MSSSVGLHCWRIVICIVSFIAFGNFLAIQFAKSYGDEPRLVNDGLSVASNDWPWWRGPHRNGEASPDQSPPIQWNDKENVRWKVPVPGRGHGSPCVVGDNLFLQTSDETSGSQSVVCIDRKSGNIRWNKIVHADGGMRKNEKSTAASSTPACDGNLVFVSFPNHDALWTTALDLKGNQVWQTKISDYVEHQGYGASPALYQSLVIVVSDNKGGGAIAGIDRKSGEIVWRRERPRLPNYPSPILIHAFGKDQLIMTGCELVTSLDPLSGDTIWETPGATTECVTSTLTDGKRVFTSGGYPKNHMSAVVADGSKTLAWENDSRMYVPSPLFRNGHLFGVLDAGIAAAWNSENGKEVWRHRLGGTFTASPILVKDLIYVTNESGDTFIYKADIKEFFQVSKNHLGSEVFATPVICGGCIYYRCVDDSSGKRQEFLYCLSGK